ncbi:hypothetical protein LguiA_002429 [Lonicera macranthoides]
MMKLKLRMKTSQEDEELATLLVERVRDVTVNERNYRENGDCWFEKGDSADSTVPLPHPHSLSALISPSPLRLIHAVKHSRIHHRRPIHRHGTTSQSLIHVVIKPEHQISQELIQFLTIGIRATFLTKITSAVMVVMNQMNLHFNNKSSSGVEDESNRTLVVTIHHMFYPITVNVLHQVFSPHGIVEKIITIPKSDGFQAHIQFQSHHIAVTTRNTLHGRNIYDGCCQLDIQLGYGDTEGKRTAWVLESDPKLEPKEDEIGPDLEQRKAEMGVDLVPKVKQEICETAKVQESSAVTDLKVNMVINMYSKYGLDGYACKVFDGMPGMVVTGNMDVLEFACEFFSHPEADTNELRTALAETKQMITWVEGVAVIGLKANAGMLTNFEVLDFLQSRGAGKDPTRVIAPIAPSEFKVYDYLEQSAACSQSREKINEFVGKIKKYNLAKGEILSIINTRPSSVVEIDPIIEECDRRMGDSVEELVEVVSQVLPPPPSQIESDKGVVEREDGTKEMEAS